MKKKSVTFDSPTWQYVLSFAHEMEGKLALNRHKGDRPAWLEADPEVLLRCLKNEVGELERAIGMKKNCPPTGSHSLLADEILKECADVGNFAMMIHDQFRAKELAKKV